MVSSVTPFALMAKMPHSIFVINKLLKKFEKGFSPSHSRIMFMFDQLKNQHHSVYMDNLYMSATFDRNAIAMVLKK